MRKQYQAERAQWDLEAKQYQRFSRFSRVLHGMVIVSFFALAITGMMLKFSYTWWAAMLSNVLGGTQTAGWIHRACAIVTFAYFFLHLWDVWRRYRGSRKTLRQFLFGPDTMLAAKVQMSPHLDVNDAVSNINALERKLKERIPKLTWCFVEPDVAD